MYNGKIFHTKTRKVAAIFWGLVGAVIIILIYINVINQGLDELLSIVYIALGLLTVVLINRHEKKQTNKQTTPLGHT